jgi:FdhE protein
LELEDEEVLEARLLQGLPLLSFAQLPVEAEVFTDLVASVTSVLTAHDPGLAEQTVPDSPTECLALARQRFEEGQPSNGEDQRRHELTLAQISVDLALKPYVEWAAERVMPHVDPEIWKRKHCPACAGTPDFAYLEDRTGARYLVCSRCSSHWRYRRLGCPYCGTDDYSKLLYYPSEGGVYRLYVCRNCFRYLKTIDLRQVGRRVLFPVERVTTVSMDVAAREEGYQ